MTARKTESDLITSIILFEFVPLFVTDIEWKNMIMEHSCVRGQTSQFIGLCKQSISDQLKQIGYLGQSIFQ